MRKKLVLVIDDDAAVRQALDLLLDIWGYHVVACDSERDAVAKLAAVDEPPCTILADYRLREGLTGVQAIANIRELVGQPVPGIIITGDPTISELQKAEGLGLTILQKPVLPSHLKFVLEQAIAEQRPRKEAAA